ncbi:MAG: hypothetical protein BGO98_25845 [Myxococcales bacterium 68-20]|nr:MAG: hypothetical protein BGO98_25845 [Myxococcales bacterium 68-20]
MSPPPNGAVAPRGRTRDASPTLRRRPPPLGQGRRRVRRIVIVRLPSRDPRSRRRVEREACASNGIRSVSVARAKHSTCHDRDAPFFANDAQDAVHPNASSSTVRRRASTW